MIEWDEAYQNSKYTPGGYWLSLDQRLWSHLAAGPLAYGRAVAMPGYPLCPEFRCQNDLLSNIWRGGFAQTRRAHEEGHHHFSVIDALAEVDSPLTPALLA